MEHVQSKIQDKNLKTNWGKEKTKIAGKQQTAIESKQTDSNRIAEAIKVMFQVINST